MRRRPNIRDKNQPPITNFFSPEGLKTLTFYNIDGMEHRFMFDENMTISDVQEALRKNDNRDFRVSSVDDFDKPIKELPENFEISLFPYKATVNFRFFNVYDRGLGQQEELLYETTKEMELKGLSGDVLEESARRIWNGLSNEQKKYPTTFFRDSEGSIFVNSKPLTFDNKSTRFIDMPDVYGSEKNVIDVNSVVSNFYPQNNNLINDESSTGITYQSYDDNGEYFNPEQSGYTQNAYGVWVPNSGGRKKKRNTKTKRRRKNARKSKRRRY